MSLIKEVFSLPKVTPSKIFAMLLDRDVSSIAIKHETITPFSKRTGDARINVNDDSRFKTTTGKSGSEYSLCKVNYNKYEEFARNGVIDKQRTFTCIWCRCVHNKDTTKDYVIPTEIPFRVSKVNRHSFIHVMYTACTYNCAYAEILKRLEVYPNDQNYEEAKRLLLMSFSVNYPGVKLIASPDYLLLEINGGPISEDVYFSSKYTFIANNDYILLPCEKEYFYFKK